MKKYIKILTFTITALLLGIFTGCGKGNDAELTEIQKKAKDILKTPNIRVVIGSTSTGGDTYQVSSIISKKLGDILGKNAKVDAVGSSNGFDSIKRVKDGSTIMIFHDMAYLGYLYGNPAYSNIFEDYKIGPVLAVNPGNAFSVAKGSKYNNVEDVIKSAGNGETVRVAIQPGGVSEIGYSAIKNAVKIQYPGMEDNLVAVNTGSQSDKNQQLFDGQAEIINSSVQANEQFNHLPADDQKAMKFIWLTASKEVMEKTKDAGFGTTPKDELMRYASPNVTVGDNFTFDKDFFVLYNKDMDPKLVELYDDAFSETFKDEALIEELRNAFFVPKHKVSSDAKSYLEKKSSTYDKIIKSIKK
jgi:tripartite-type tricarboxylate transporter receptor subunit TctC